MSSSIYDGFDSWDVSNMMFWRVIDFACEVGSTVAKSEVESQWVQRLRNLEETVGTYSPDLEIGELFETAAEMEFWWHVLNEVATQIYQRQLGNQKDQTWQVSTIWAAFDLGRLLYTNFNRLQFQHGQNGQTDTST